MNLKEGTRRLALLLGAAGAIAGGFASYVVLRDAFGAQSRHAKFELLVRSDAVQRERNSWPLTLRYTPDKAIEQFHRLPENQQRDVFSSLTQDEQADLVAKLKCEPLPPGAPSTATTVQNLLKDPSNPEWSLVLPDAIDEFIALPHEQQIATLQQLSSEKQDKLLNAVRARRTGHQAEDDPFACIAEPIDPPTSTVNTGPVKTIHWTKDLGVESIETQDGQTVYPSPPPNRSLYLLAALLPVVGFLIPWGVVRAIGWVGAGFVTGSK